MQHPTPLQMGVIECQRQACNIQKQASVQMIPGKYSMLTFAKVLMGVIGSKLVSTMPFKMPVCPLDLLFHQKKPDIVNCD